MTRSRYAAISARLWRAFEGGEITSARLRVARFEELLGDVSLASDVSARYIEELGRESGLLPQAERVVEALAQSYRLLLATNGIADIQRSRFAGSTIAHYFHDIVISDEIGVAKPHAEFFDEAFARMGTPPRSKVLMVGDSLSSDIAGGIGYGIDACWFDLRRSGTGALASCDPPLEPRYRIEALDELLSLLT